MAIFWHCLSCRMTERLQQSSAATMHHCGSLHIAVSWWDETASCRTCQGFVQGSGWERCGAMLSHGSGLLSGYCRQGELPAEHLGCGLMGDVPLWWGQDGPHLFKGGSWAASLLFSEYSAGAMRACCALLITASAVESHPTKLFEGCYKLIEYPNTRSNTFHITVFLWCRMITFF